MDRNTSFCMFVATFIVLWSSSFTNKYKVQGFDVPTRHRQCKLRGFDTACLGHDGSCTELRCGRLTPDGHVMEIVIKPQDGVLKGTKCDEGRICINKKCVPPRLGLPRYSGDDEYHECKPAQPIIVAYTRTEQCQRRGFAGVCEGHSTACDVLHCARKECDRNFIHKQIPIWGVEIGTKCGENKICINRECVNVVGEMPVALGGDVIHHCTQDRIVPGEPVKTRHEQCVEHGFDVACRDDDRNLNAKCRTIRCGYEIFPGMYFENVEKTTGASMVRPMMGTKCGQFRTCQIDGCKPTAPNNMPTYTGNDIYQDCYRPNLRDRTTIV